MDFAYPFVGYTRDCGCHRERAGRSYDPKHGDCGYEAACRARRSG